MDNESPESAAHETPQHDIGLMLHRRAMNQLQRESEKPPRSPKRIALVSIAVLITMSLFMVLLDKGVKVAHRIIDIWTPVIFDVKKVPPPEVPLPPPKSVAPDTNTAYMIKVEPTAPAHSGQTSSVDAKTH